MGGMEGEGEGERESVLRFDSQKVYLNPNQDMRIDKTPNINE